MMALTTNLIPHVSSNLTKRNYKKIRVDYQNTVRISTYLGFLMSTIFMIRGKEICILLYDSPSTGGILAIFGLGAAFIYYFHVSNGFLHGLGKANLVLINLSIGSIFKVIGIYLLASQISQTYFHSIP